jgi:predicted enzyme related to lactoylglutathione lyase
MLQGMATVTYSVDDLEAAKRWYAELLGIEPYFNRNGPDGNPAYIEFRIGKYQHELGLVDSKYRPRHAPDSPGGVLLYWHVDDVSAALERLLELGATLHEPRIERGEGWITGSVVDPFGNLLGVIYNPLFVEILGQQR